MGNNNTSEPIRVLVVEDSPTAREVILQLLADETGIRVIGTATDGRKAVDMAAEMKPDLIIMDVVMPDMDGLEATRHIMQASPTAILIVTAHYDSKELNVVFEAMKAGALDVMSKPTVFSDGSTDMWEQELVNKVKALGRVKPGRG
ncbi:MAG: response regulator [Desulfatibacillaceae bacterium]